MSAADGDAENILAARASIAAVRLDGSRPLAAVRQEMAGHAFGLVVADDNEPIALITPRDLERAEDEGAHTLLDPSVPLPAAIVAGGDATMDDVVNSPAMSLLNRGAHGVAVVDKGGAVSVVPAEAIRQYLASGEFAESERTLGLDAVPTDAGLPGSGRPFTLTVRCMAVVPVSAGSTQTRICGYPNQICRPVDEANMPACQSPDPPTPAHRLRMPFQTGP